MLYRGIRQRIEYRGTWNRFFHIIRTNELRQISLPHLVLLQPVLERRVLRLHQVLAQALGVAVLVFFGDFDFLYF